MVKKIFKCENFFTAHVQIYYKSDAKGSTLKKGLTDLSSLAFLSSHTISLPSSLFTLLIKQWALVLCSILPSPLLPVFSLSWSHVVSPSPPLIRGPTKTKTLVHPSVISHRNSHGCLLSGLSLLHLSIHEISTSLVTQIIWCLVIWYSTSAFSITAKRLRWEPGLPQFELCLGQEFLLDGFRQMTCP